MMEEVNNFLKNLTSIDLICQAEIEAVKYWGADIPTTVLFAEIGRSIVKNFDKFSNKELAYIFDLIEKGLNSLDANLSAAVATGLLEALSGQASKDTILAKKIDAELQEKSRKYLADWNSWPGT
nr:hypothetical protein [uncultured Comamonas sp.]